MRVTPSFKIIICYLRLRQLWAPTISSMLYVIVIIVITFTLFLCPHLLCCRLTYRLCSSFMGQNDNFNLITVNVWEIFYTTIQSWPQRGLYYSFSAVWSVAMVAKTTMIITTYDNDDIENIEEHILELIPGSRLTNTWLLSWITHTF